MDSALKYVKLSNKIDGQLYNNESMVHAQAISFAEKQKQQQAEADKAALKNSRQRWGLAIAITFLLIIALIFWRNSRLSKKANALLPGKNNKPNTHWQNLNRPRFN
jgi:hypothetical protein